MNELIKYWAEKDKVRLFYLIHGHFKTELISRTNKAKKRDKTICIIWKVKDLL